MKQMELLKRMLDTSGVPYEIYNHSIFNSEIICYPSKDERISDAICQYGSYGYEEGLIEIIGLTENDDEVEGNLSALEVYERWAKHYRSTH